MHVSDIDSDLVDELAEELEEKRETSSELLLKLEDNPNDSELIRRLFREIHTMKGDLGLMGLQPYVPLMQAVEDILDHLRKQDATYSPALGDVLLLVLDYNHKILDDFIEDKEKLDSERHEKIIDMVVTLGQAMYSEDYQKEAIALVQELAPETAPDTEEEVSEWGDYLTPEDINEEIAFFMQISLLIDQRSPYGAGRTSRIFELAMTMNHMAEEPIPYEQLQAALYLHDLGMAFVPMKLMRKDSDLNQNDWRWIKNHVTTAHQLIDSFEIWQEAAEIILHHHERLDGSGYPNGLKEDEICDGAKLLGIVDSFEAITQKRAYQTQQQRPIIRAITEINNHAGKLYCPKWVSYFNRAVKRLHTKKPRK